MLGVSTVPEPGSRSKRFCGIRPTTFILSPGLAGAGGSLAAKRTHGYATIYISSTGYLADQIQRCWHSSPTSSFLCPSVSKNSSCPTTNSTSQATNTTASALPTSDCDKLANTYSLKLAHTPNTMSTAVLTSLRSLSTYSRITLRFVQATTTSRPRKGLKQRMLPVMRCFALWTSTRTRKTWARNAFSRCKRHHCDAKRLNQ